MPHCKTRSATSSGNYSHDNSEKILNQLAERRDAGVLFGLLLASDKTVRVAPLEVAKADLTSAAATLATDLLKRPLI